MADYFLVKHVPGPAWDPARPRREQDGWDEHAAFMDGLVAEGVIVLGGPVGAGEATTRSWSSTQRAKRRSGLV